MVVGSIPTMNEIFHIAQLVEHVNKKSRLFKKEKTMSRLVNALQTNDSLTENGAVTHSSTGSAVLNLFFTAGASRNKSVADIEALLAHAFDENSAIALKIVFWAGDMRGS